MYIFAFKMNFYTSGMNTKSKRQQLIEDIIKNQRISRQEDLMEQLLKHGFSVTQATLSRDLKELKVGKIPDPKHGSIYFISTANSDLHELHGLQSIEWARETVIIKCISGFANSIAALIDEHNLKEIAGTLAGNDTIFIILKESYDFDDFKNALLQQFSGIDHYF
jgi:transcriptional regulator of arginine metabolism